MLRFASAAVVILSEAKNLARHSVTIYSKSDCHLCERMKEVVQRCREHVGFDLQIVDISQDRELFERYCNDIPVVLLDGREIARHVVRERKLLELLKKS